MIIRESGLLLSNIRSVLEIFVFDSSNFESIHQCAAPSRWTYVLLQAVAGMAMESLCHPNSKHTNMDIHGFDSSAANDF